MSAPLTIGRISPCQGLIACALRDSDSAEERYRKQVWIPVNVLSAPVILSLLITAHQKESQRFQAVWWGLVLVEATALGSLLYPLLTRSLPKLLVANSCVLFSIGGIVVDMGFAAVGSPMRAWTTVVVVMDVLLALDMPRSYQRVVLAMVSVYGIVLNLEYGARLGLFDIPNWTDQKLEWHEQCADPPCAIGIPRGIAVAASVLFVFHADFFATRGFAESSRREQAAMAATITVADQVAADLARFDLDAAARALAGAALPPKLMESFQQLLSNLASYRPYLPESCFAFDHPAGPSVSSWEESRVLSGSNSGNPLQESEFLQQRRSSAVIARRSTRSPLLSPADGTSCGRPRGFAQEARLSQQRHVTLLLSNRCGFLAGCVQCDADSVRDWMAQEVERCTAAVHAQGGTLDTLSADHLSATFGALKTLGSHRPAATRAAWSLSVSAAAGPAVPALGALRPTAAACSGRALCGDFGSTAAQRFMVIGGVSSFAAVAERTAAAWGIGALIDTAVHSDAEQFWSCRLRKKVSFPKLRSSLIGLWEVVADRLPRGGEEEEWMYELDRAAPNPWEQYNAALLQWYSGTPPQALLEAQAGEAQAADGGGAASSAAAAGLRDLLEHIQCGCQPAAGDFSPRGLFGDPAPFEQSASPPADLDTLSCESLS